MMERNYSIDGLTEQIHSPKTKEYFKEVILTYYTGAYRSCVVTLYSVVICDLVFKLQELRDIYNDDAARKILVEIEKTQIDNPKNPDWESQVIEQIRQRTSILEQFELEAIYQLQKWRHLSAHPVLTEASILHTPNKETVTAHIRNMLEYVLTKPPIFSKKMANTIIEDISFNKDRLMLPADLKRYLEAKYLRNARPELYHNLFKLLWKFAFKVENDDCNQNRQVNIQVMAILYNHDRPSVEQWISNESAAYEVKVSEVIFPQLMDFLFDFPKIYACLSEQQRILIDAEIESKMKYKLLAWFKHDNFDGYLASLEDLLVAGHAPPIDKFDRIVQLGSDFQRKREVINFGIKVFGRSGSYATADTRFAVFIEPFLDDMTETQLGLVIVSINSNSQINERWQANADNGKVRSAMEKANPKFDYSHYTSFR
jgi:Icc-related predicted phosphoesterase